MAHYDRRFILAVVLNLVLAALTAGRAAEANTLLSPDTMRADIAILADACTNLHPGLYRYLTPAAFLQQRQRLEAFCAEPKSLGAFYLALSAFTASVRCGHSFLNPSNQTAAVTAVLFGKPDRLPFAFEWLDKRMIVTKDLGSGFSLAAGTEIVSIDGVGAYDILTRMLPYARTDGANDARKAADLGIPGDAEQPSFDVLRSLLYPAASASARVTIRAKGRERTIVCPLLTAAARNAALDVRSPGSPYGWQFITRGSIGVLDMPTWAVFHEKWDWQRFIDDSVDAALDRKLSGIVIDLRANSGGLDCGAAILARLIDSPLATNSYTRHVRYRASPERLAPYLKTWDRSFRDWGASAKGPDAQGFYTLDRTGDATESDIIVPAKRRYTGKVVVLIGPKNASATFGFAALIKQHKLATLIGEPTGGNLRGINGGAFFFVNLPGSGLEVDLPLIAYWPASPQLDAGVTPDILVKRQSSDVAEGVDHQMARAMLIVG